MDLKDFVGTYTVTTADLNVPTGWSYDGPSVAVGQQLTITANGGQAAIVTINGHDFDFNWESETRTLQQSFDVIATPLDSGAEFLPAFNQISLVSGNGIKAIYASTLVGDPQQVGVWGAESSGG